MRKFWRDEHSKLSRSYCSSLDRNSQDTGKTRSSYLSSSSGVGGRSFPKANRSFSTTAPRCPIRGRVLKVDEAPVVPFGKRAGKSAQEQARMPAYVIKYEVLRAGPEASAVREALNEAGRRGFVIRHTRIDDHGVYTFILSKETGLHVEEQNEAAGDWIADGFVNEETSWHSNQE